MLAFKNQSLVLTIKSQMVLLILWFYCLLYLNSVLQRCEFNLIYGTNIAKRFISSESWGCTLDMFPNGKIHTLSQTLEILEVSSFRETFAFPQPAKKHPCCCGLWETSKSRSLKARITSAVRLLTYDSDDICV